MSYSDLLKGTISGADYATTASQPNVGAAPQSPTQSDMMKRYFGTTNAGGLAGGIAGFTLGGMTGSPKGELFGAALGGGAGGGFSIENIRDVLKAPYEFLKSTKGSPMKTIDALQTFAADLGLPELAYDPGGLLGGLVKTWKNKKWYRDYRKWGDYLRTNAEYSLGTNGEAYDPLSGMQRAITQQIQTPGMTGEAGVRGTVASQTANSQRQMANYASAMGAPGAMQGMIAASGKLRQSMADRAVANYMPQAWAQNEQYSNEISAMLQSLAKSEFETAQTVKSTGRSV